MKSQEAGNPAGAEASHHSGRRRLESERSQPRILVTGGAGFIGRYLVRHLLRQGFRRIAVLDNLHRRRASNIALNEGAVRFINGDIRDRNALARAMRGTDLVFHLAAQSNVLGAVQDPTYCSSANVAGTAMVLEHARAAGVRRVVFTSSREVYGDPESVPVPESAPLRPKNTYGMSKVAGEMCCSMYSGDGIEIVILRLANVYGSGDFGRVIPLFIERALRGDALSIYGGSQIVDFVHVSHVVDVLLKVAFGEYIRGPINVGSGKGTTIAELADRILRLAHSGSRICVSPSREMEVVRFVADIARARQLLGFDPPDDPLHGLAEQVAWSARALQFERTPPTRSVAV